MRKHIFISYSHADSQYLQRLRIHLRPFERAGTLQVWSDAKIKTGSLWRKEIKQAIDQAAAAILLVSADFLASDFIALNELPPLLKAASEDGLKVFPIVLKPCAFREIEELSQFQAINDPAKPLISMRDANREEVWSNLAKQINDAFIAADKTEESVLSAETAEIESEDEDFLQSWTASIISEELKNPAVLKEYYGYEYQHIDYLLAMPKLLDLIPEAAKNPEFLSALDRKFREIGWEGDGDFRILWFPPFAGVGVEDTYGVPTFLVKQSNNGSSWILSPVPLPFQRLLEQNR